MKLRSTRSKDKTVGSQTGISANDERKGKAASTVGNGATKTTLTQSASSFSIKKTKIVRAHSQNLAIAGSSNVSAPKPSSSGAGVNVITGPAASTRGKKNANVAKSAPVPTVSTGVSNNYALPPTSSIANVAQQPVQVQTISSSGDSVGPISKIPSTFANRYGAGQPLSPLKQPDSTSIKSAGPSIGSSGVLLPALPPNWDARYIDTYQSSSIYRTFPVENSSSEFKALAGLLPPFRITSAEQVINPELWQAFDERRKTMLRSKSDDLDLLKGLGFDSAAVARSAKFSEHFTKHHRLTAKYGEYSANEALLFHCTKDPANLEKIVAQGLDERLGGNGLLGRGVHFSDDPEKFVKYDGTWGTILVFGVLLGDCLSVDNFPNVGSFVREPEKEAEQKRNKNDTFFDSITRGSKSKGRIYNEYVIFNRNQCYPFYIIKYQRGFKDYLEYDGQGDSFSSARKSTPIIAWQKLVGERVPMPKACRGTPWPFHASFVFKLMETSNFSVQIDNSAETTAALEIMKSTGTTRALTNADIDDVKLDKRIKRQKMDGVKKKQKCSVCNRRFDAFLTSPSLWKVLRCNHRMCFGCYSRIEISRTTMSGISCASVRCPFCQGITGILVGDCPDGLMTVNYINSACDGDRGHNSIEVNYNIKSGTHRLNRTAYLPNSPEGKEILELLITAWDRKLTFVIGTSMTTGQQNVFVCNVSHKTSQTGGVQQFGYPDEEYFTRVREELIAYGID